MAYFKEPLHNANDITVTDVKFTAGDINISFHRFDAKEAQECPKQLRPSSGDYYAGTTIHDVVVYKDAIHIFGGDDYYNHLAYREDEIGRGYEYYNDIPYPFIHSKAVAAGNELYLIGLSGAHGQNTVYGNVLLYNDESDSFSLYYNYNKSLEYADAYPLFDDTFFKVYRIYIFGGLETPTTAQGILAKSKGFVSPVSIPLSFNNEYSHAVVFNDHLHIFAWDSTNNIMLHYYHEDPEPGGASFIAKNSFSVDKISNVIAVYGKLYAFTYHSGIYVWNEDDDTWSLLDNTVTNSAYFYPRSVVLYKNKVHVFNWAPNRPSSYRAYHTKLSSLYTIGLGEQND